MDKPVFIIALVPWAIAMWAMFMMVVTALQNERPNWGWLFGGSFTQASYNRKYFRIFAIAVLADVGFVGLVNALFFTGWLKL